MITLALPLLLSLSSPTIEPPSLRADDGYRQAAEQADAPWEEWADSKELSGGIEKSYKSITAADHRVVIWYPKGTASGKLKRTAEKAVDALDKLFPPKGREQDAPPRRAAVLFPLAGPKTFESVTTHIGRTVPRLAGWAKTAPRGVGFLLEEPLVAGWLLTVPDREVFNSENELVNRLTRLVTIERYGRLPYWLGQGLAWQVELSVCKDVYCFPFRSGFVSKKEHKSWPKRLTATMAARGERPITIEELSGWSRNTWNEERAILAWGAVSMLAKHYEKELPGLLAAYARLRAKEGKKTEADGSWQWIPDYEISAEKELELLNRELGVDFLAELNDFARKPRGYVKPR
jgi:hypothetical protein